MLKKLLVLLTLSFLAIPAFCQTTSKWQVAAITEVKPHPAPADVASDSTSYDVSVKVGDTVYVVLYTPLLGELPPKYATGHELLVLVAKNAITYNDMLGRSYQVPIESQRPATEIKPAK